MSLLAKERAKAPKPRQKTTKAGLGPVVIDGVIRFISPSQMETFDPASEGGCERKWWFRYVKREQVMATAAAKLGVQCHSQLEHYLKTGEDVLGDLVRAGKRFIPAPGPDLLIEHKLGESEWPGPVFSPRMISPLKAGGVPFVLMIDLMHRRETFLDDDGVLHPDPGTAEVRDWKTTAQIDDEVDSETGIVTKRGYAKTGPALASTWQMTAYGEVARLRWPDLTNVRLSHGYFQSKGQRAASLRSHVLTAEEVSRRWQKADALVERMQGVARAARAEDVPANYGSCRAFGGCPFRQSCPRDPKLVLAEALGGGHASRLMEKAAGIAPSNTKQIREETMGLLDRLQKKATAPVVDPAVAAAKAELIAEEKALRPSSILPPDVPAPDKIAEPHEPGYATAAPAASAPVETKPNQMSIGGVCLVSGTQIELPVASAISKKWICSCGATVKVRPKEMAGKPFSMVPQHVLPGLLQIAEPTPEVVSPPKEVAAPAPLSEESAKMLEAGLADAKAGRIVSEPIVFRTDVSPNQYIDLYLDCAEDGIALKRLEPYVEKLCRALEEEFKAADIRCADSASPLGFGKWRGGLAALVRTQPPEPGAYAVSSSSEVGMVAFEALASLGRGRVVRGAR